MALTMTVDRAAVDMHYQNLSSSISRGHFISEEHPLIKGSTTNRDMVGMDLELARFMKCMESTMKIQFFADTGSVIDLEEGFSSDMDIDATAASSSLSPTPTYNQLSQIASLLTLICITPNRWMSTTSFLSLSALVEPKINICAALRIMVNLSQGRLIILYLLQTATPDAQPRIHLLLMTSFGKEYRCFLCLLKLTSFGGEF